MNIGERLTTKIGPLPVYAWGAIAGVGVWLLLGRTGGGAVQPGDSTLFTDKGSAGDSGSSQYNKIAPYDPLIIPFAPDPVTDSAVVTTADSATGPDRWRVISEPTPITAGAETAPPLAPKGWWEATPKVIRDLFLSPFFTAAVSEITPADKYGVAFKGTVAETAGFAPNQPVQIVGGIPFALSDAAIMRGGIPAIDIPGHETVFQSPSAISNAQAKNIAGGLLPNRDITQQEVTNVNAYREHPETAPSLGEVIVGGQVIGHQTSTGFFGGA